MYSWTIAEFEKILGSVFKDVIKSKIRFGMFAVPVSRVQLISEITCEMMAGGIWKPQPDNGVIYPNVPTFSGYRQDLVTFVHYAGAIPDRLVATAWSDWDAPASRDWFAQLIWQSIRKKIFLMMVGIPSSELLLQSDLEDLIAAVLLHYETGVPMEEILA